MRPTPDHQTPPRRDHNATRRPGRRQPPPWHHLPRNATDSVVRHAARELRKAIAAEDFTSYTDLKDELATRLAQLHIPYKGWHLDKAIAIVEASQNGHALVESDAVRRLERVKMPLGSRIVDQPRDPPRHEANALLAHLSALGQVRSMPPTATRDEATVRQQADLMRNENQNTPTPRETIHERLARIFAKETEW